MDLNSNRIGEIVLLDFPYTNLKGSKLRPALIVGASDIQNDFLVAFVTSEVENYIGSNYAVVIEQSNIQEGFIKQKSIIRCDKLITISSDRILRDKIAYLKVSKISRLGREEKISLEEGIEIVYKKYSA